MYGHKQVGRLLNEYIIGRLNKIGFPESVVD